MLKLLITAILLLALFVVVFSNAFRPAYHNAQQKSLEYGQQVIQHKFSY